MNSSINKIFIIVGASFLALILGLYVVTADTGGVAAVVKVLGAVSIVFAFLKPKVGVLILLFQGAYFDMIKRLAVVSGEASYSVIIQVLAIPMLTLAACFLGTFVSSLFGRGKIEKKVLVSSLIIAVIGAGVLLSEVSSKGLMRGVQAGINSAGYLLLIPIVMANFKSREELFSLFRSMIWIFVPTALYGIKQALFGFSHFEWVYAETGLSITSAELFSEVPRPYSTLSSATGMAVMGAFAYLSMWFAFVTKGRNMQWFLLGSIYFTATLLSLVRGSIVTMLLSFIVYYFLKTKSRVVFVYVSGAVLAVVLVLSAGYIRDNLGNLTGALPITNAYSKKALNLNTLSDRLYGLDNLKDPDRWTPLGVHGYKFYEETIGTKYGSHDLFNELLLTFGYIPLFVVGCILGYVLYRTHLRIFAMGLDLNGKFTVCCLAYLLTFSAANLVGGNIFHVTPVNAVIWIVGGAIAALVFKDKAENFANTVDRPKRASIQKNLGLAQR